MNDGQMNRDTRLNRTVNRITFQNLRQSPRFSDKIYVRANAPLFVGKIHKRFDAKEPFVHLRYTDWRNTRNKD